MGNVVSHLRCFAYCCVLLFLSLLFLLFQLLDALLQHIGPKVPLKIWKLVCTRQTVLCGLLEDVLSNTNTYLDNIWNRKKQKTGN